MLLLGSDPLTRFLNEAAARPFAWGEWDCLLWLAEWVKVNRGIDPAAGLRGEYGSMLTAAKVVKRAGGMSALVEKQVRPFGIKRVEASQRGDIAVIPVAGPGTEHFGSLAGSIILEGSAALFCQDGLLFNRLTDAPPVAVWRV